jgi:anthranilate synthase component 1
MKHVAQLEQETRGIYTGSIGYLCTGGDTCFSVAIRTAVLQGRMLHLRTGGGIVFQSDADEELLETIAKANAIMRAYEQALASSRP